MNVDFFSSVTEFMRNQGNCLQLRSSHVKAVAFTYCIIIAAETGYGEIGFKVSVGFQTSQAFIHHVIG
jgi:hypothetical protein